MCVIFSTEMFHMFNSIQTHICIFFVTFFQINIINNRYKTTGKKRFFLLRNVVLNQLIIAHSYLVINQIIIIDWQPYSVAFPLYNLK